MTTSKDILIYGKHNNTDLEDGKYNILYKNVNIIDNEIHKSVSLSNEKIFYGTTNDFATVLADNELDQFFSLDNNSNVIYADFINKGHNTATVAFYLSFRINENYDSTNPSSSLEICNFVKIIDDNTKLYLTLFLNNEIINGVKTYYFVLHKIKKTTGTGSSETIRDTYPITNYNFTLNSNNLFLISFDFDLSNERFKINIFDANTKLDDTQSVVSSSFIDIGKKQNNLLESFKEILNKNFTDFSNQNQHISFIMGSLAKEQTLPIVYGNLHYYNDLESSDNFINNDSKYYNDFKFNEIRKQSDAIPEPTPPPLSTRPNTYQIQAPK